MVGQTWNIERELVEQPFRVPIIDLKISKLEYLHRSWFVFSLHPCTWIFLLLEVPWSCHVWSFRRKMKVLQQHFLVHQLNIIVRAPWVGTRDLRIDRKQTSRAFFPRLVSKLNLDKSCCFSVEWRSPWVRAPILSRRRATTDANRCSPASSDIRNMYSGGVT